MGLEGLRVDSMAFMKEPLSLAHCFMQDIVETATERFVSKFHPLLVIKGLPKTVLGVSDFVGEEASFCHGLLMV